MPSRGTCILEETHLCILCTIRLGSLRLYILLQVRQPCTCNLSPCRAGPIPVLYRFLLLYGLTGLLDLCAVSWREVGLRLQVLCSIAVSEV